MDFFFLQYTQLTFQAKENKNLLGKQCLKPHSL